MSGLLRLVIKSQAGNRKTGTKTLACQVTKYAKLQMIWKKTNLKA